jgi:vacuolar protein sorting-associated protein 29
VASYEGILFLNPGSATGAYSSTAPQNAPSFIVLDAQKDSLSVFVYRLNENDEVEITQYNHTA